MRSLGYSFDIIALAIIVIVVTVDAAGSEDLRPGLRCNVAEGEEGDPCGPKLFCNNLTAVCHACLQGCKGNEPSLESETCPLWCADTEEYCDNDVSVCARCDDDDWCGRPGQEPWVVCPPRCKCTSHADCNSGEYCPKPRDDDGYLPVVVDKDTDIATPVLSCQSCDYCDPTSENKARIWNHPIDGTCPYSCSDCSTNKDCDTGKYCSTKGYVPQEGATDEPTLFGRCLTCDNCKDRDVIGNEECSNVCSSSLECFSTLDCGKDEYCWSSDQDFKSDESSYMYHFGSSCQRIFRYKDKMHLECWETTSWGRGRNIESEGYSFGCPESICDISNTLVPEHYATHSSWYIPLCNDANDWIFKAGWTKKTDKSMPVEEFAKKSKACSVTRHNAPNDGGQAVYPKSVVFVDCTEIVPDGFCEVVEVNVAVWTEKSSTLSSSSLLEYYDDQQPMYVKIGGSESCAFDAAIKKVIGIIVGCTIGGFVLCLGIIKFRRHHHQQRLHDADAEDKPDGSN